MTSNRLYRHHPPEFKLRLCQEIRTGLLTRREAQRTHNLSANLIQRWLTLFDRKAFLARELAEQDSIALYEERIAALERKVGQLTMEIDKLRKDS